VEEPIFVLARSEKHALKVWARRCGFRAEGIQGARGIAALATIGGRSVTAVAAGPITMAVLYDAPVTDRMVGDQSAA
jgi:hypothetical protein